MDIKQDMARLAALTALSKAINREIGKGDPDNLRGRVDSYLLELRETANVRNLDLMIGEEQVGTVSVTVQGERPTIYVDDVEQLVEWAKGEPEWLRSLLHRCTKEMGELAKDTGEVPRGCSVYVEPPRVSGTTVRVDVDKAVSAGLLSEPVAGLLGGDAE